MLSPRSEGAARQRLVAGRLRHQRF